MSVAIGHVAFDRRGHGSRADGEGKAHTRCPPPRGGAKAVSVVAVFGIALGAGGLPSALKVAPDEVTVADVFPAAFGTDPRRLGGSRW